jgi:metal-responsive CopG/Arc/MetJ family transcriptional regulator
MNRTTIFADPYLLEELRTLSQEEKKTLSATIREALESYVSAKRSAKPRLSFAGKFKSGKTDIADRHEELLWK